MRRALLLAQKGWGDTTPNPMVGAVLVKDGRIIGQGYHRRPGLPHAEIEALNKASMSLKGASLYVTLEPCCTTGRTGPCTEAIIAAGIKEVVVATSDPNPKHRGKGVKILEDAGVRVTTAILEKEATRLNRVFNHWIQHRTPYVTLKAAMSLDAKIGTKTGESKWITSEKARAWAMRLRKSADAILVGINTVINDDPSLTYRGPGTKSLRRIVLDPSGRAPASAKIFTGQENNPTTVISGKISLPQLLKKLGAEGITHLLVEGGGETHAKFLEEGLAHRICFLYAPIIIGGQNARKGVAGEDLPHPVMLKNVEWSMLGPDLLLDAELQA